MDATIKEERERILAELLKYASNGTVNVAVFKLEEIVNGKE